MSDLQKRIAIVEDVQSIIRKTALAIVVQQRGPARDRATEREHLLEAWELQQQLRPLESYLLELRLELYEAQKKAARQQLALRFIGLIVRALAGAVAEAVVTAAANEVVSQLLPDGG